MHIETSDQGEAENDLKESLADEQAGRMRPLTHIAAEIRDRHGYSLPD